MDYILSEKRQKVLEGIDKFGVVTSVQLEKFFPEVAKMTIFRTRQQVEEMGLAETKVFGRRKVLCITKKGSEYVGRISRGAGLSYSNLQHDLTTNDVIYSLLFDKNYSEKGFDFRTERELKEDIYLNASFDQLQQANFMRHISNEIPDFILENQEGNKLAFEVELSRKTNKRIQEKMKLYKNALNNGTYEKVFYVYKDEQIKKHVDLYAQGLNVPVSFISLHSLLRE